MYHAMQRGKWHWVLAMIPLGALLGVITTNIAALNGLREYEAETTIQMRPAGAASGLFPSPSPSSSAFQGWSDQIARDLRNPDLQKKAIEELQLHHQWGLSLDQAAQRLQVTIACENIPGTDLHKVRVRSRDQHQACNLANALIEAYDEQCQQAKAKEMNRQLRELNEAVMAQEAKVNAARAKLAMIANEAKFIVGKPDDFFDLANELDEENKLQDLSQGSDSKLDELVTETYIELKSQHDMEKDLLDALKLKQIGETIGTTYTAGAILVHDPATAPAKPVMPDLGRRQLLGGAIGAAILPLIALCVLPFVGSKRA